MFYLIKNRQPEQKDNEVTLTVNLLIKQLTNHCEKFCQSNTDEEMKNEQDENQMDDITTNQDGDVNLMAEYFKERNLTTWKSLVCVVRFCFC